MAAVTSTVLSGLAAGYQIYSGAKDKKNAENALNNFERQDLSNPYENIQLSTIGTDAMREESGRTAANLVENSRGDMRSIMGNIPRIVALNNEMNKGVQVELDNQNQRRDYAIAGDETNIRGIQEGRDNADLSGIGTQLNVGRQDMWSGIKGVVSTGMYAANNLNFSGKQRPEATGISELNPVSYSSIPSPRPSATVPNLKVPYSFTDYFNNNFYGF